MTSSPESLLREVNREAAVRRAAQSGAAYPGRQLEVLQHRLITKVHVCAYPNCKNRMSHNSPYSFYRLSFSNGEMLKLWLIVLQMDANTPVRRHCALQTIGSAVLTSPSRRREEIQSRNTSFSRKRLSHGERELQTQWR